MHVLKKVSFSFIKFTKTTAIGIALFCASTAVASDIPTKKQTDAGLYLTAAEAAAMLSTNDVALIDVRSRAEVAFLGMPSDASVNLPYMMMPMIPEYDDEKGAYSLEINPDFPTAFKAWASANGFDKDSTYILMCRSGSRSAKAANLIYELGYTNVYSVVDGYEGDKAKEGPNKGQRVVNGWRNAGLDWSYKISSSQVYPDDAN